MSPVHVAPRYLRQASLSGACLALMLALGQSEPALAAPDTKVDAMKQGLVPQGVLVNAGLLNGGNAKIRQIYVGNDASFGVFLNNAWKSAPGDINGTTAAATLWGGADEFYPPSSNDNLADFGVLVRVGSTIYAPDFNAHSLSAAKSCLPSYTPWTSVSGTVVTGTGTDGDPLKAVTSVSGAITGGTLRLDLTTTYASNKVGLTPTIPNSDNFFTHDMKFTNNSSSPVTFEVYLLGDHYIAGSDYGLQYVSGFTEVGSLQCIPGGPHRVRHTTATAANFFTEDYWCSTWGQVSGNLNNAVNASCVDNGSGLQWHIVNLAASGGNVTIQSKTTFDDSPPYVPSLTASGILLLTMLLLLGGGYALQRKRARADLTA